MKVEFVDGLRVSDEATVEVAKMVLVGKQNKDIVLRLGRHGQPAVGLCGDDGMLFTCKKQLAGGERDIGFVGEIERVDVDVLNHIAEDYIPVVASVGADSEGHSYNVNADAAAAAVASALRAYKVMFLTDVEGWLADPADHGSLISAEHRGRGDRGAAGRERRHAAEARGVRAGAGRRGRQRAHRGRPPAALAAAGAVHRRGQRHQAVAVEELQALEAQATMGTYARNPVEFVRGEGTRLWDAEGNEYLDFLAGISVVQIGHCHPALVEAVTEQASRLMHVGNLYYTEPAIRLAARLSELSLGGKAFLCNSGAEAIECALKLARRHRAQGGFVVVEGGFHGRTMGALSATPQEAKQAPFAPLVPGFAMVRRDDPDAIAAAVGPGTAAVLLECIQGEGGIHPLSAETLAAAARPPATSTARCSSATRSSAAWAAPATCGAGRSGRAPRRDDGREGPRRRAADRRLPHHARSWPTRCSPATTARPSPAGPWWPPARTRCSTWSPPTASSTTCARRASGWPPAWATPASTCAAAG